MKERIGFAFKVVGLSLIAAAMLVPAAGMCGLLLYIALDPWMPADDLASFMLFFLPLLVLGLPGVVVASRFAVLRTRWKLQLVLFGSALLLGTLGFAGFWVGAMGI